jgi:3-hydroxybutyryl-CoA dehydrogenase
MREIRQIAVIGAGLMGHGIAQAFARKDYPVTLYDLDSSILEKALSQVKSNLETFVEAGLEPEERVGKVLSKIRVSVDLQDAVKDARFVIEAAPEDLKLKTDLFERLDRYCPEETILASNTSTFPMSEIGKKVRKQGRLVITHWFNPPHIVPAVEVVRGEKTSDEVFETTYELMKRIGKRPVRVLKEVPGFLINRIQTAMFREILFLLEQGVAKAEDIDAGVKGSFGLRLAVVGPLETVDMAGLDIWSKGVEYLFPFLDGSTGIPDLIKEKIERREFGLKTGKGFFQYGSNDAPSPSERIKNRDRKLLSLLRTLSD